MASESILEGLDQYTSQELQNFQATGVLPGETPVAAPLSEADKSRLQAQADFDKLSTLLIEMKKQAGEAGTQARNMLNYNRNVASKLADEMTQKYDIDVNKIVEEVTSATESAIKKNEVGTEEGIAKLETATANTIDTLNKQFGEALGVYSTGVEKLRGEQAAKYGSAEEEQTARARQAQAEQKAYLSSIRAQQGGIGKEEPIAALQGAAEGKVESAAEKMIKQQAREAQQRAQSAAFARGFSPAAQRAAIMAGSQAQMTATGQAATMRAEEQAAARQQWVNAFQNRQSQLAQAEQFGLQLGLNNEQLFQKALDIRLQGAAVDRQLTSDMIAQRLGLQTTQATMTAGMGSELANRAFNARQQQTQNALALRQQQQQQNAALRQSSAQAKLASQADITNAWQGQAAGLENAILGVNANAAAAVPSMLGNQMSNATQTQLEYAKLAQQADLARKQMAQQQAQFEASSSWENVLMNAVPNILGGASQGAGAAATTAAMA